MGRRVAPEPRLQAVRPLPDALPRIAADGAYKTKFEIIQDFRTAIAGQFETLERQGRLDNADETADIFAAILEYRITP